MSADPHEINQPKFREMLYLLSMDVVSPFYELMGLRLDNPEQFQSTLREAIIAWRKQILRPLKFGKPQALDEVTVAIEGALDIASIRQLAIWGQNIFQYDSTKDGVDLRKWNSVLNYCLDEPTLWARLRLPGSATPGSFQASRKIDEYYRIQKEVDESPLSDWDLHLYALFLYDDLLYFDDPSHLRDGPRVYIKLTIRANQGFEFWAAILNQLNVNEIEELWKAARQIVEEEGLRLARELPHPSALEIWK
jgi:hypothetical protein